MFTQHHQGFHLGKSVSFTHFYSYTMWIPTLFVTIFALISCIVQMGSYSNIIHLFWVMYRCIVFVCMCYLTNRLHFSLCVYCNRPCNRCLMTSQHVKNKKNNTRWSRVVWLLFFARCDIFCDLLRYTCMEKCNLQYIIMDFWRIFWAWKKKNKSADVDLTPSVCVSFNSSQSTTNKSVFLKWKIKFQINCIISFERTVEIINANFL